ncbi:MAG: hypothetical protein ACLQJR_24430 [Stellaceae bacterium]
MQHARKLDIWSRRAIPAIEAETGDQEPPWPRRGRVIFIIGAATACWAAVLFVGYWLLR